MSEKLIVDTTMQVVQMAEKGVETLIKKAWSIMDAATEKETPSQYLSERAIHSIQGEEK